MPLEEVEAFAAAAALFGHTPEAAHHFIPEMAGKRGDHVGVAAARTPQDERRAGIRCS